MPLNKHEAMKFVQDRVEFNDDEIETIRLLIKDRGFEYALQSKDEKVRVLAKKLGMDRIYCEE